MYFTQEFINNVIFDCSLRQAQGKWRVFAHSEPVEGSGQMECFRSFWACQRLRANGVFPFILSLSKAQGKRSVSVHPEPVEGSKEEFMVLFDTLYSLKLGSW